MVCQNLLNCVAPIRPDGTIVEYMGKVNVALHYFNDLLRVAFNSSQELKQRSKFFMLLSLDELLDYSHVHNQILGSLVLPNLLLLVPPFYVY